MRTKLVQFPPSQFPPNLLIPVIMVRSYPCCVRYCCGRPQTELLCRPSWAKQASEIPRTHCSLDPLMAFSGAGNQPGLKLWRVVRGEASVEAVGDYPIISCLIMDPTGHRNLRHRPSLPPSLHSKRVSELSYVLLIRVDSSQTQWPHQQYPPLARPLLPLRRHHPGLLPRT